MTRRVVLAISGAGANDAIRGMVTAITDAISSLGVPIVHVTAERAELNYAVEQMRAGNVAFGFTWLGTGQFLPVTSDDRTETRNAWEAYEVPLLKYHGDIPAYFEERHRDTPSNSVNLYPAAEFVAYRERWMPDQKAMTALVPPLPLMPMNERDVDFDVRRRGKVIFLKNGNSPDDLRALWQERLPRSVARLLDDLVDATCPGSLRGDTINLGDAVAEAMRVKDIEPRTMRSFAAFLTAQLDDYLRRVKSNMITRALLDLPVIIQGDHWDHVDFRGRRAVHVPGQDYSSSQAIFARELGIIDMSPNVVTCGHERVYRAAGAYSLALTNRQSWIERELPGHQDLTFDFTPESIAERVDAVLQDPAHYIELARSFGRDFRRRYPAEAFANHVIDLAELAVLHYGTAKPSLQPFFVWPRS